MYERLSIHMDMYHMCVVALDVGRGGWIPKNWSYRQS